MGIALLALAAAAACSGQSCSCLAPIPGGFNPGKRIPNAVQARVGMQGISYLQQHVSDLINAFVPGGLSQSVPCANTTFADVCCGGGDNCRANVAVTSLALNPQAPNRVDFTLRARVSSSSSQGNYFPVDVIGVGCHVRLDTTLDGNPPDLGIVGHFTLQAPADPTTDLTSIDVSVDNLIDLETGDIDISGGFLGVCNIGDLFKGFIIDQLKGQLLSKVQDAVNQQLCQKCQGTPDCAPFGDACQGGLCMRGGRCIQKLGTEGRADAGSLISQFAPGLQAFLDLYLAAGHYADANNGGIALGILSGMEPAAPNACVPRLDAPAPPPVAMSPTFDGNVNPRTNAPFDVALGLHKSFLEHGAWAAWQSGVLCLDVATGKVPQLTSGTFTLLAPSLDDLVHGQNTPLLITIRPQSTPQVTLGAGTLTTDGMGHTIIQEPLLTLLLPDFQLEFYVFSDDRYIRAFTLTADVTLPLALEIDGQNQLVPILGDTSNAFQNIRVTHNELLSETAADLAMKFPAILSIALPLLTDALPTITLPDIMGIKLQLTQSGVTSTDNDTFLALFTNLSIGSPITRQVETSAEIAQLRVPPTEAFRITSRFDYATGTPAVLLRVGGQAAGGAAPIEWQYRIDGGFWSPFQRAPELWVRDPILLWQGRHEVAVRARLRGAPETLDATPVLLPLLVDTVAPEVTGEVVGTVFRVHAHDLVSPDAALRYAVSRGGAAFVPAAGPEIPLGPAGETLAVQVTDEAGNAALVGPGGAAARTGTGCAVALGRSTEEGGGGSGAAAGLVLLALLGGAVAFRRRRARTQGVAALLAILAAAGLSATGCGDDATGSMNMNPDGGGGPDAPRVAVPGTTGRWSDLAAAGGKVLASGYEEHYGDLVVATADPTGRLSYQVLDGVPAVAPSLDPTGYRGGIADPGDDVGLYTAIELDAMGRARVSYFDATHGALKLALANDATNTTWTTLTVDTPPAGTTPATPDLPGVRVGLFTSLTIDATGAPQIAYLAHALPDGMGGFGAELRFARAQSPAPASNLDFTIETVDTLPVSCAGLCDAASVCAKSSATCQAAATGCAPACPSGQACALVGASPGCIDVLDAPQVQDLPDGVGLFARTARLANDDPIIVYYDRTNGNLKSAVRTSSDMTWHARVLDGQDTMGRDTGDMGQWCSVAVETGDVLHIAYQDGIAHTLRYLQITGGSSVFELVDDGLRPDGEHSVGNDTHLMLDATGAVRIVYQDGRDVIMQQAQRMAPGMWMRMDLPATMQTPGHGFFPRLVADGASLWASDLFYDRARQPFGQLEVVKLP